MLSADQREAIELSFYGGYTHPEIAGRLELPLGTAKAPISRGLSGYGTPCPRTLRRRNVSSG